jgi:hypothetical protein
VQICIVHCIRMLCLNNRAYTGPNKLSAPTVEG